MSPESFGRLFGTVAASRRVLAKSIERPESLS